MQSRQWDDDFEALLVRHLPLLPAGAVPGADLDMRAAGLDSIQTIFLLTAIEETFEIELSTSPRAIELLSKPGALTPGLLWKTVSEVRDGSEA